MNEGCFGLAFEHHLLLFREAWPVISDLDGDIGCCLFDSNTDRWLFPGVFDGIVKEFFEHPFEAWPNRCHDRLGGIDSD